jgi:hypothetical protein
MIVGVTGTRKGLTEEQKLVWENFLELANAQYGDEKVHELHHGGCIGADDEIHNLTRKHRPDIHIVVHPCTLVDQQAPSAYNGDEHRKPKAPLSRNQNIIGEVDALIVFPGEFKEKTRGSGTWATYRYGRQAKLPVTIIFPDGNFEEF